MGHSLLVASWSVLPAFDPEGKGFSGFSPFLFLMLLPFVSQ